MDNEKLDRNWPRRTIAKPPGHPQGPLLLIDDALLRLLVHNGILVEEARLEQNVLTKTQNQSVKIC